MADSLASSSADKTTAVNLRTESHPNLSGHADSVLVDRLQARWADASSSSDKTIKLRNLRNGEAPFWSFDWFFIGVQPDGQNLASGQRRGYWAVDSARESFAYALVIRCC